MQHKVKYISILLIVTILFIFSSVEQHHSLAQQGDIVVIGSKNFDEAQILSYIVYWLLDDEGFIVVDRTNTGNTSETREAILRGDIDAYVEYTATGALLLATEFPDQVSPQSAFNPAEAIATVASFDAANNDLLWLVPAPANNAYGIAVTREFANANSLQTIEDLALFIRAGNEVVMAGADEFFDRDDAYRSFADAYGFEVPIENQYDMGNVGPAGTLAALENGELGTNVAMAYTTAGELVAGDFVVLEDTLGAQPIYNPVPVFRGDVVRNNPEILPLLRSAFALLDDRTLQRLNARVTLAGETPSDVAYNFLLDNALIGQDIVCIVTRDASSDASSNMREGPGINFAVRGSLGPGVSSFADALADDADGGDNRWYRLANNLYIREDTVDATIECSQLPIVNPDN